MSHAGWIGVDLDGTLAHYDKWRGVGHVGEPVPVMLERVKRWLLEGREVRIFTARIAAPPAEVRFFLLEFSAWCAKHGLPQLQVTNVKDFQMIELWDDRAVQVIPNTGVPVGTSTRGLD